VAKENAEFELKRLRAEQAKTRQDEVFGGLSPAERAGYDAKTKRINELEIALAAIASAKNSRHYAKANQRAQWNEEAVTDTPQSEAHQPYGSRETDSSTRFKDSTKNRGKAKGDSENKSGG
jgi:hypothetical protein